VRIGVEINSEKIKYIAMCGETSMQDKITTERQAINFFKG
jgi:hypothetical protein